MCETVILIRAVWLTRNFGGRGLSMQHICMLLCQTVVFVCFLSMNITFLAFVILVCISTAAASRARSPRKPLELPAECE